MRAQQQAARPAKMATAAAQHLVDDFPTSFPSTSGKKPLVTLSGWVEKFVPYCIKQQIYERPAKMAAAAQRISASMPPKDVRGAIAKTQAKKQSDAAKLNALRRKVTQLEAQAAKAQQSKPGNAAARHNPNREIQQQLISLTETVNGLVRAQQQAARPAPAGVFAASATPAINSSDPRVLKFLKWEAQEEREKQFAAEMKMKEPYLIAAVHAALVGPDGTSLHPALERMVAVSVTTALSGFAAPPPGGF